MKTSLHIIVRCMHLMGIGVTVFLVIFWLMIFPQHGYAAFGDCPPGYFFDRNSGVGCKQTYCNDITNAHWSYEGRCVCGSSGSVNEDPKGPNKECFLPHDDATCPDCIVACVHHDEKCPSEFGIQEDEPEELPTGLENASFSDYIKDAFGQFMSIGADLLEAATDIKIKETTKGDTFYQGLVILPSGESFDMRLFHSNFSWNETEGIAAEFNIIEIKTPTKGAWVDSWSIGVGIGSASKDDISPPIPNTPISPGISIRNIRNWFSDEYASLSAWYRDNAPWYLGGGEPSPIGGGNNR